MILSIFLKDYDVVEASNGAEAVEAYKKYKPDVVIMDIVMPNNGWYYRHKEDKGN